MPRLTNHGEVVFEQDSRGRTVHPFWGSHKDYWPGAVEESKVPCGSCNQPSQPPAPPLFATVEAWFDAVVKAPSDFHEHMPTLRDLAAKCEVAVELSQWLKPALLAMAAGKPKRLVSVCPGAKPEWGQLQQLLGKDAFGSVQADPVATDGFSCDLLFIDTLHQAGRLRAELEKWGPHCRHYIAIHCTVTYGERGDDGGPGVLVALRDWVRARPEWSVVEHYQNNHGLTVLSCQDADKAQLPNLVKQAWNFGKAMAKWKLSGLPVLSDDKVEARLAKCDLCKQRVGERCGVCGCPLLAGATGGPGKAFIPTEVCPIGFWHAET